MAYATLAFYNDTYHGRAASDSILDALLERAADDLDFATLGQIDLADLEAEELDVLAKANCAQAEYYVERGTSEITGQVSLGSFSISNQSAWLGSLCQRAARYLARIGLLDRSVARYPMRDLQDLDGGGVIPDER